MAISPDDRKAMLDTIRTWPPEDQEALVREIVAELTATSHQTAARLSIYDLAGIALPPGQTPPSDAQIAHWLDERRMKEAE